MILPAIAFVGALAAAAPTPEFLSQHDLVWEVPAERWIEGIPLANGDIGALVWGDGAPLKITLDKYDAWDTREKRLTTESYQELRRLVEEGKKKEAEDYLAIWRIYADGHDPTRLPLPRLEIDFGQLLEWGQGRLSLASASLVVDGTLSGEPVQVEIFVCAEENVLLARLRGRGTEKARVRVGWDHLGEGTLKALESRGYPRPKVTSTDTGGTWHLVAPTGYELAIAWNREIESEGNGQVLRLSILSSADSEHPLEAAKQVVSDKSFLDDSRHRKWWAEYWKRSFLTIPDARLEALYYAEMYKLGCCSRPGKLPITLQGLWTLDGQMPPWSGDYHLDMNVEQSYWPIYTANRLELGEPLYRTFSACIPRWREQCRQFFGFEGICSGCAIGPHGERIFGYTGVELWPGNAAWLAHHYWLHYLYSQDDDFLREEALPMIRLAFLTYANLLETGEDGKLHIPLSYSPEWGEGSFDAFCRDPNCDLALIRFLGKALLESREVLDATDPIVNRAEDVMANLTPYLRDGNRLLISANTPLSHSHRHFSHLMAIHPLGLLTMDGTEEERDLIQGSLRQIRVKGTGEWTGWAFPWMSLIASRAGLGNTAWQMLDVYCNAFISPNTFHMNGDPRIFGLSQFDYEPMTLEAGFGAAAAIMEMLLQSQGGRIRVFPTVPDRWHDAYFENLRTEGAFLVTARLEADRVSFAKIHSEKGGTCSIVNPFGEEALAVFGSDGESWESLSQPPISAEKVISIPTEKGRDYLLVPEGRAPGEVQMKPVSFTRNPRERNFYGKKLHPNF